MHYNQFFFKQIKKPVNDVHNGIREFYYWNLDSIQYVNPHVQIVRFTDSNPIPFIRCWLDSGEDVLFDCDSKSREEIMSQLIKILGKSDKDIENEKLKNLESEKENPAIFGFGKERFCMCEIEGQVPCGGVVELPKSMQSKYYYNRPDDLEAIENDPDSELWDYERLRDKFWTKMTLPAERNQFKGIERYQFGKLPPMTKKNIFEEQSRTYLELRDKRNKMLKKK